MRLSWGMLWLDFQPIKAVEANKKYSKQAELYF